VYWQWPEVPVGDNPPGLRATSTPDLINDAASAEDMIRLDERNRERDSRRVSDVKHIQLALELYYDGNKKYPERLSELSPEFIDGVPRDPYSRMSYHYELREDGGYVLRALLDGDYDGSESFLYDDYVPGNQFYEVTLSPPL
jgi:hypothetical protein